MESYIKQAASIKNIYLAYLRLKNTVQNEELFLEQEVLYFEKDLDQVDEIYYTINDNEIIINDEELKNIGEDGNAILRIRKILLNEVDIYNFNKFDFITKIKSTDDNISYRPLTRYRFFDLVIMQSIFNVVFEKLKNFLPKENYGVQLSDNPKYLYKNWANQYKKFAQEQKKHSSKDSLYQYAFEYDIKEFYPSISQRRLLDDIVESINLDKEDIFYKWIEKIIYHYNADNISIETKNIFKEYCEIYEKNENESNKGSTKDKKVKKIYKDDLGLPQGPLFSSFLAVFYIRNLYKKFADQMNERGIYDFIHFSYIDDGRIYLQDNKIKSLKNDDKDTPSSKLSKESDTENSDKEENTNNENKSDTKETDPTQKIKNILNNILKEINGDDKKVIQLNDKKVSVLSLDEKSVKNKLDFLTSDASLINSSINPRFEIPSDLEETVRSKHEAIKNKLEEMYKKVEKIENKTISESEIRKIKKEYKTYSKRRANFLTRKISTKKKFYEIVEIIFECESKSEDYLKDDINNFNYYYNVLNLMRNAENDINKIKFLVKSITNYLDSYEEKISKNSKNKLDKEEMMLFYYLSTIKAIYQVPYSKVYKKMLDDIKEKYKGNLLIEKYYYSYTDDSWIFEMKEICKEDSQNKNESDLKNKDNKDKDTEKDAIIYYKNNPIKLKKITNIMVDRDALFKQTEIDKDDQDIEHVYRYRGTSILIRRKINDENEILFEKEKYEKLNSDDISEYKKLKWISLLLEFWKKEIDTKRYINPAYLIFDNIRVTNEQNEDNNLIINDNKNILFNLYGIKDEMIDYKEYLRIFFMDFFKCDESIIVNSKGKTLKFWEYRILSFLHNKMFNREDFFDLLEDIVNNYDYLNHEVDTNFEKIRAIVDDNLGSARDKDVIVCLHYYLHCVWKNGSKDLTFYTLHNQEHSIELIQNYMKLSPMLLNKFTLNKNEKFILFSACYLHDIGMLKGLAQNEMYNLKNLKILKFYEDVYKYFKEIKIIKMETMLRKIYSIHDKTEQLFEHIVRDQHPTRAKKDIVVDDMLPLTDLEKKYISEVSENHGNDYEKVYGLLNKEKFRKGDIDIRKISIWLRLLDLTDISKSRVTQAVFSRYFERMGTVSRFHWLKHLCVNQIEFKCNYESNKLDVKILINMNYLPPDEELNMKCKYSEDKDQDEIKCFQYEKYEQDGEIKYKRKEKINKKCKNCSLLCAFLNENSWFAKEVDKLNWYSSKYYNSEINFTLEYVLDDETKRDKFEIYSFGDAGRRKVSAEKCMKEYLVNKYC